MRTIFKQPPPRPASPEAQFLTVRGRMRALVVSAPALGPSSLKRWCHASLKLDIGLLAAAAVLIDAGTGASVLRRFLMETWPEGAASTDVCATHPFPKRCTIGIGFELLEVWFSELLAPWERSLLRPLRGPGDRGGIAGGRCPEPFRPHPHTENPQQIQAVAVPAGHERGVGGDASSRMGAAGLDSRSSPSACR